VLPPDHPLADSTGVRLEDLAGEHFVDCPLGFGNRIAVDRAYAALGLHRRVAVEVSDLRTVPEFVAAGLGVAVVPQIAMNPGPATVRLPLLGSDMTWPFTIVTPAGRKPSRALATLLALIEPA
jgi:DNA-binding transcriptional LysR family regulator